MGGNRENLLRVAGVVALLALSASGCDQSTSSRGTLTARDCTPFPKAGSVGNDPGAVMEDCVHRWSYVLGRSHDAADLVAQAVVNACADDLSRWNEQALNQSPAGAAQMAPSLTNGAPTDAMGSHAQYAQSRALFYVVQGRAGDCATPPPDQMPTANPPAPANQPAPYTAGPQSSGP